MSESEGEEEFAKAREPVTGSVDHNAPPPTNTVMVAPALRAGFI
jgi:hypothetical protein